MHPSTIFTARVRRN